MVFNNIYARNKEEMAVFYGMHDNIANKPTDLEVGSTASELDTYIHAKQKSLVDRLVKRQNTRIDEPNARFVSFLLAAECHELT